MMEIQLHKFRVPLEFYFYRLYDFNKNVHAHKVFLSHIFYNMFMKTIITLYKYNTIFHINDIFTIYVIQ